MTSFASSFVRFAVFAVAMIAGFTAMTAVAQADREFNSPRYSVNEAGSIHGISNSSMSCKTADKGCAAARSAGQPSSADSSLNNDNWEMAWVDQDSDSATFNSTSADQALPAGSSILYAALYWGGRNPGKNDRHDQVKLKLPGSSSYQTVTSSVVDRIDSGGNAGIYQAFADVTHLVKPLPDAGNGTYWVADIKGSTGKTMMAGWSLIVAYRNPNETMKNLTIFDGLVNVGTNETKTITVNGFRTPPAGQVNAKAGFVTWEGDLGIVGDSASLNGHTLSDAEHKSNNFFNSRISHDGVLDSARNPAHANGLGFEAAWLKPPAGAVKNGDTSAKIAVTTGGDNFVPGVITFQVEIYAPKVDQTKAASDVNGGNLEQGDVITYRIAGRNNGQDGTANFVLRDSIPANTTYVPGSIKVVRSGGAPTGSRTDQAGDDTAEFDPANKRVIARLGTGSNATLGGNIAPGQEYEVTFQVTVNGPDSNAVPDLTAIDNKAVATYNSQTVGTNFSTEAENRLTVKSPDLRIRKTRTGADFVAGGSSQYTFKVDNHGSAKTQGLVKVTDPLAPGLTATAVNAPGWSCNTLPAAQLTCTRSDTLAPGASYPDIVVTVAIGDEIQNEIENLATVSGGGDANLTDNTSSSTNPVSRKADMAIVKTASKSKVKIGDSFTYTLKATNNGPSKATSVAVTDPIPAGLSFVSADPGCTFEPADGTVVCSLGSMASGASKAINITVKVDGDAGGTIRNTATVGAQQQDPDLSNNSSTAEVDASGADLKVTKKLKSPTGGIKTGDTITYEVVLKNNGPSDATGVVLYDALPGGLVDVITNKEACTVTGGAVNCVIGDLANGASFTVLVTGKVKPGQTELTNTASASGNEDDPDPANNTSTVTDPVTPQVDLSVLKTASVPEITPGDSFDYTFDVKNNGPDNATGVKITDLLPAGLAFVSSNDCTAAGQNVTCVSGALAAGQVKTLTIKVKARTGVTASVKNTGRVKGDQPDPDPSNNESTTDTPVVHRHADVAIVKTVDNPKPFAGETVTYTLTAKNNGPGTAENVVVTDQLPAGVTFISADAPCVESDGEVSCELGDLAPGDEVALRIKVKINGWPAVPADDTHGIDVQKVETQIDLEPGQTRTVRAECPSGYFVSDGSVRIDHIDQGTGSWLSPEVTESRAIDSRTWQGTVTNTATGRAQAKVFAVCIRETTTPSGHSHGITVSKPVVKTISLKPGGNEAVLKCPIGTVAVAPGFVADSPGHLVYSQPQGNGWKFVYTTDANKPHDKVAFSIRCMNRQLTESNGTIPELALERIWTEQVIQPGQVHEIQLTCPDGSKGIVGGWDLDKGLASLGNDPRPVTRAFKVYNPTDKPLTARFSLLCLDDRTVGGDADSNLRKITNTAEVVTATDETDYDNNSSSVTITANRVGEPVPDGTGKPPVNNPTDSDIHRPGAKVTTHGIARYRGGKFKVKVRASGKTRGRIKLVTSKRVKLGGKRIRKGTVLATGSYRFGRAGTRSVGLRTTRAGRRLIGKKGVRTARLLVGGKSVGRIRIGR